jgi:NAD-specific glutamate dehydrogenase
MTAILKARAELLYFGGIGNYVKAQDESHATPATRPMTRCASTARTCA